MDSKEQIIKVISSVSTFLNENISIQDELVLIGIDSLRMVELIVVLEDSFNIIFDDSDLDPSRLVKVADIVNLTEKYIDK